MLAIVDGVALGANLVDFEPQSLPVGDGIPASPVKFCIRSSV